MDTILTTEALHDLLDADLAFETRSRNDLSSHLGMELVALHSLGAPDEVLERRFRSYAATASVPREDPSALESRREEVWSLGIPDAVRARAGELVDSPATEWLHAPIRLAYAVETAHTGQVANALLSWDRGRRAFTTAPPRGGDRPMIEVLRSMAAASASLGASSWDLVEVGDRRAVHAEVDRVRLDEQTWDDLAAAAAAVYAGQPDFGSLHMVTGTHAVRVLAPLLAPSDAALLRARTAQTLAAAFVVIGAPGLPDDAELSRRREEEVPSWTAIHEAAVQVTDAHVAKFVYTATREHDATGDPLYRWLAARTAGLVPQEAR